MKENWYDEWKRRNEQH